MTKPEFEAALEYFRTEHGHHGKAICFALPFGRQSRCKSWRLVKINNGGPLVVSIEDNGPDKPSVPVVFPLRDVCCVWPA